MDQPEPKATGANKYLQPYKTKRQILFDNFLGGIAWSLGTLFGLTVIAVIIGFIISRVNLIPIIGDWMAQIIQDATGKIQPPTFPQP